MRATNSHAQSRGLLVAAAAVSILLALAGESAVQAAPADLGTFDFLRASGPPVAVPGGSTLVPSRTEFAWNLGIAPAGTSTPQAAASDLCVPDVGTPTVAPSGANGAVAPGPTGKGVIVSAAGYLVFDKSNPGDCLNHALISLKDATLFGPTSPTATETFEGPQVVFDPHANKFVVAALSHDSANDNAFFYYAISTDATASAWTVTRFRVGYLSGPGGIHVNTVNVGFSKDVWIFTYNLDFFGFLNPDATAVYELRKSDLATKSNDGSLPPGFVPPRILDDSATAYFLRVNDSPGTAIRRIEHPVFTFDFTETTPITVPAFTAPPAVVQNNGQKLDAGDGRFQGPSIQIGTSLWNVHTVDVGGHARVRLYKFSTTGTTPLLTFTPTILGYEDLFNPTMATGSDGAGSKALVSASGAIGSFAPGAYMFSFNGPNDSAQGWSYDILAYNSTEFETTDGSTPCTDLSGIGSCAWVASSATAMEPDDSTSAWSFNQLVSGGTAQTDWAVIGGKVSGPGTGDPPMAPVASAATGVTDTGFVAHWSDQPPALGYQLDVSTDAGFTAYVSGFQNRDVGNTTSFPVTGLMPTTNYFYRVSAVGAFGTSLPSNTIPVTTTAAPPPPPPSPGPPGPTGPICVLTLAPDTINAGETSMLSWTSSNATSGTIDNGVGAATPVSAGSTGVSPSATTTYTGTFTGPGGSTTCIAALTIATVSAIDPVALLALLVLALTAIGLRFRRA